MRNVFYIFSRASPRGWRYLHDAKSNLAGRLSVQRERLFARSFAAGSLHTQITSRYTGVRAYAIERLVRTDDQSSIIRGLASFIMRHYPRADNECYLHRGQDRRAHARHCYVGAPICEKCPVTFLDRFLGSVSAFTSRPWNHPERTPVPYRTEIRGDANNTVIQWLNAHRQPLDSIRADSEIRGALSRSRHEISARSFAASSKSRQERSHKTIRNSLADLYH